MTCLGVPTGHHLHGHPQVYREHLNRYWELRGDYLTESMRFYLEWNEKIEPYALMRFRVEDLADPACAYKLVEVVGGRPPALCDLLEAIESLPRTMNTRNVSQGIERWSDLPDGAVKERLRAMASRYGY